METVTAVFYVCTLLLGIMAFFMKVTSPNAFVTFLGHVMFKVGGLFVIFYSGIQLYIYFHLIKPM